MKFECQRGCTQCCEQKGFVYLSQSDVPRIAAFLSLEPAEFERRYLRRSKHWIWLRTPVEGSCVFLKAHGCSIHAVKPVQCRAFPFWPELLESREQWRETATMCPGIGKGEVIPARMAQAIAQEVREAYPATYNLVTISPAEGKRNKVGQGD